MQSNAEQILRKFVLSIAHDNRDALWQPDWFALKDKAWAVLEQCDPTPPLTEAQKARLQAKVKAVFGKGQV